VLVEGQLDYSGEPHCVIEAFSEGGDNKWII
jgi:hypothetical protein